VSAILKCMSEIWGIPSPTNRGQNHLFRQLHILTANLTACIFGMKHDTNKRVSALATRRGLLHRLQTTYTLVHKRLKFDVNFNPPYEDFAFSFIARLADGDQQTELNQTGRNGGR